MKIADMTGQDLSERLLIAVINYDESADVLFTAAKNGMSNFTPVTIKSMTETLMEMCGEEQFELMGVPTEADEMMYIMSNTEKVNGAAAIIDPNNMDLARSYMQDDFYILPSSVHEVLLVKQNQMSV